MAEKYELKEFRDLLRKAIGPDRTQAEFAEAAGITPQHLSKMLTQERIPRPAITTLRKIAGHAFGGITLNMLLTACGYEVDATEESSVVNPTKKQRAELSAGARAKACVEDLKSGFQTLSVNNPVYGSLYDFVDMVNTIYAVESVSYRIDGEKEIEDEMHPTAELSAVINASWTDTDYTGEMEAVVYYCKTRKNAVVVMGVAFDYDSLLKADSAMAWEVHTTQDEINRKEGCLYTVKYKRQNKVSDESAQLFNEKMQYLMTEKGLDEKEAMLQAIFGDPDRPKRISTVEGEGFYIDRVPEYAVINFLHTHQNTFCRSQKEQEMLDRLANGEALDKIFEYYDTDSKNMVGFGHWGVAIANVMYRETNIQFDFWDDVDYDYNVRPCIMFSATMPYHMNETEKELSRDTLIQILDQYARELKTEVASDCYTIIEMDVRED